MDTGERVRAARNAMALSQEQAGVKAGLTARTIGDVERGVRVKPATLKQVADALGIPWDDLREQEGALKIT